MERQKRHIARSLLLFAVTNCTPLTSSTVQGSKDESDSGLQETTREEDGIESKSDLGESSNGIADRSGIEQITDSGGSSRGIRSVVDGGSEQPADQTGEVPNYCSKGFLPEDDGSCVDTDECALGTDDCDLQPRRARKLSRCINLSLAKTE